MIHSCAVSPSHLPVPSPVGMGAGLLGVCRFLHPSVPLHPVFVFHFTQTPLFGFIYFLFHVPPQPGISCSVGGLGHRPHTQGWP